MKQLLRTATEAALSVPEILSLVFSYGTPRTKAASACVCKKWSEVALDELWRDLEDIYPLLKLLIPFDSFYDEYHQDEFEHEETLYFLRDADWPRFRQYAARVKSIAYHEIAANVSPPSKEGIALICLYYPYGNCLTPNVRTLRWTLSYSATITPMMPFMSQCLEELRLKINLEATETQDLFLGLTHRTPTLKRLSIESEASPRDVSSSLSRWIRTCLGLEKANIPRRWQTSTIVTAFGSLPNLLEFGIHWNHSPIEHMSLGKNMEFVEGHFQNLQRLGWCSDIKEATDLLQQTSCRLRGLALDCPERPSEPDMVAFIASVAHRFPDLDSFCLNLIGFVESIEPDGALELLELPVEMLRPLLSCSRLRQLRIHYPGPCILSPLDLEDMGAAWPNMEELVLCPDPDGSDHGPPISTLPCVAAAFPRIRLLGLHFDHLDPPDSAGDLLPEIQFRCLKELNVGASPVPSDDTTAVGLYLTSLFAVGTRPTIKAEVSGARCDHFYGSITSEEWETIERMVHGTMQVKEAVFCRLSDHWCPDMKLLL